MIWIGTSGFKYAEWKGTFYPGDLPEKKMLVYYATQLPTTEINSSFYGIPRITTLSNWAAETPANFRFSLKAPQEITHFKRLRGCDEVIRRFWEVAAALNEKLGVVLFQLPPNFKKDLSALNDFLEILPHSMKCAFEFRDESWFSDEVFNSLRAKNAALCIGASEKIKTPTMATTSFSYFRLRDEGYTKKDIASWAEVITEHGKSAKDVYVYFKHEESGVGPKFATQLMKILGPDAAKSDAS